MEKKETQPTINDVINKRNAVMDEYLTLDRQKDSLLDGVLSLEEYETKKKQLSSMLEDLEEELIIRQSKGEIQTSDKKHQSAHTTKKKKKNFLPFAIVGIVVILAIVSLGAILSTSSDAPVVTTTPATVPTTTPVPTAPPQTEAPEYKYTLNDLTSSIVLPPEYSTNVTISSPNANEVRDYYSYPNDAIYGTTDINASFTEGTDYFGTLSIRISNVMYEKRLEIYDAYVSNLHEKGFSYEILSCSRIGDVRLMIRYTTDTTIFYEITFVSKDIICSVYCAQTSNTNVIVESIASQIAALIQ